MSDSATAWLRIEEVFLQAVDLPEDARRALLDEIAKEEPEIAAEVESLLGNAAPGPIERAVAAGIEIATQSEAASSERAIPERIGPWLRCEEIGRGGLATVYRAEREEPFRQVVAIKILRSPFAGGDVARRLALERQILARLEHPGIARLIDGGTLPDGRPYLVMERVEGVPIDEFAAREGLSVRARIELFRAACAAVTYAHQNLIVHRDLKPSNLLVGADGQPKLLDFGIAKPLENDSSAADAATEAGLRMLTPAFAAPEQILGLLPTTATDVYALGVLLYRLLSGRHPHCLQGSGRALERRVLDEEPDLASQAIERREADFADALWGSPAGATRLARALRGDLDGILAKALAKRPEERYPSVEQLGDDLGRHLAGLPVRARRATLSYRAGRFARRHRAALAAASLAAVGLLGGAATALWQAHEALAARERAEQALGESERQRLRTERVTHFLIDLFEAPDPARARGTQVSARELLDRGAATARKELAKEPALSAAMLDTMGQVYSKLGSFEQAEPLLTEAVALSEAALGAQAPETTASRARLGLVLVHRGRYQEAEQELRAALAAQEDAKAGDADLGQTLSDLGMALYHQTRLAEAETALGRSLQLRRRGLGADHPQTIETLNNLAAVWLAKGDLPRAESALREALARHREKLGQDHPSVATNLNNLGALLAQAGRLDEAEAAIAEALAIRKKVLGDRHPQVAETLANLGWIRMERGTLDGAREAFAEARDRTIAELGAGHPNVARIEANLGDVERAAGRADTAERHYRAALAIRRKALPANDPLLGYPLLRLGEITVDRGEAARAEPLLAEAAAIQEAAFPAVSWQVAEARSLLGRARLALGRGDGAEILRQILPALRTTLGTEHRLTRAAEQALARIDNRPPTSADGTRRSPR